VAAGAGARDQGAQQAAQYPQAEPAGDQDQDDLCAKLQAIRAQGRVDRCGRALKIGVSLEHRLTRLHLRAV
jgi:hypothetical protein